MVLLSCSCSLLPKPQSPELSCGLKQKLLILLVSVIGRLVSSSSVLSVRHRALASVRGQRKSCHLLGSEGTDEPSCWGRALLCRHDQRYGFSRPIRPRGDIVRWVSFGRSGFSSCLGRCRGCCPAECCAIDPDTVQDDGQFSGQGDLCLLHTLAPCDA